MLVFYKNKYQLHYVLDCTFSNIKIKSTAPSVTVHSTSYYTTPDRLNNISGHTTQYLLSRYTLITLHSTSCHTTHLSHYTVPPVTLHSTSCLTTQYLLSHYTVPASCHTTLCLPPVVLHSISSYYTMYSTTGTRHSVVWDKSVTLH
jgi:hypothetical protein